MAAVIREEPEEAAAMPVVAADLTTMGRVRPIRQEFSRGMVRF